MKQKLHPIAKPPTKGQRHSEAWTIAAKEKWTSAIFRTEGVATMQQSIGRANQAP